MVEQLWTMPRLMLYSYTSRSSILTRHFNNNIQCRDYSVCPILPSYWLEWPTVEWYHTVDRRWQFSWPSEILFLKPEANEAKQESRKCPTEKIKANVNFWFKKIENNACMFLLYWKFRIKVKANKFFKAKIKKYFTFWFLFFLMFSPAFSSFFLS